MADAKTTNILNFVHVFESVLADPSQLCVLTPIVYVLGSRPDRNQKFLVMYKPELDAPGTAYHAVGSSVSGL